MQNVISLKRFISSQDIANCIISHVESARRAERARNVALDDAEAVAQDLHVRAQDAARNAARRAHMCSKCPSELF